MSKTVTVTKQVEISFWGFIKDQKFGISCGFWLGFAVHVILEAWLK